MKTHRFHPTVLREYDIRGIVGDTLSTADALAIGWAYGSILRNQGRSKVCAGYDGRISSPDLAAALRQGLTEAGVDVFDIGRGPTPMLYFAVHHLEADGGIMITGSHNPPDHNGFKMMLGTKPFFGEQIRELGAIVGNGVEAPGGGKVSRISLDDIYVERLLAEVTPHLPETGGLNVAWDPGNGAAGEIIQKLVKHLPGRHVLINEEIDGTFPAHHPDPTDPKTLTQLRDVVREQQLDLGLAFDGDGDRLGAIDSRGRIVWGDQLLSILARDVLAEQPGATIIADVKASKVLFDEIAAMGGAPLLWRTGHSLIKSKMAETGAPLAGEMSGHIFFADRYYGFDDAIYAAIRLLGAVSRGGGSLAALYDSLPQVINTPELRFPCPDERKFDIVAAVRASVTGKYDDVIDIDGVRVTSEHGWWLLRASNTQAVLVARCEARDEAGLNELKRQLALELEALGLEAPEF
ncbi:MAG: phosphoglucomutase/phosphomannomutase PgmG [Sphingomonadales bacterium]